MNTPDNPSLEAVNKRGGILLVDDDPVVRESLALALESEAYNVIMVGSGPEALRRMQEGGIDLVLLDLNLPVTSGWDVFERMTAISPFLPIIIITARADQYELAAAAGATALMEKPLSLPLLVETIDRLLQEGFEKRVQRILRNQPLVLTGLV